jgi:hypothetical protein
MKRTSTPVLPVFSSANRLLTMVIRTAVSG